MIELNMIYNEDCLEGMKRISDKSIDLVVTDPPYWHKKSPGKPYSERKQCETKSKFSNSTLYNAEGYMMGEMSTFGEQEIDKILKELTRVCKIPNIYLFCNETQVPYYTMWAEKNGLMFSILVWEKPLSIINKNRFSQNLEFIVRIYDYGTGLNRIGGMNDIYNRVRRSKPVSGMKKEHPTQKPLKLIEEFLLLSSKEGDLVLDPFMGINSTGIACKLLGRKFIGFEINKKYFNVAQKREDELLC